MMNRKDLEELLGHSISDVEWKENQKMLNEMQERMWEEDHPMDD